MFANSKNPLAADLIKEFKLISKEKSIKPTSSLKPSKASEWIETIESPSRVLLSRLRSKDSDKDNEERTSDLDMVETSSSYGVRNQDLRGTVSSKSKTSSTLPRRGYVYNQQVNKELDQILALKAKTKPVPLPVCSNLKERRTKSVEDLIDGGSDQKRNVELTVSCSMSLDSWDSDENIFDNHTSEELGSYYEEPNVPESLVPDSISPTSGSQRGYYPFSFISQHERSDSGKSKPPIPTPRPKDSELTNYHEENADRDHSRSGIVYPKNDNNELSSKAQEDRENIYETLDFRGSLDIDSEDEHLPDILRHTKSKVRKPADDIYESLDRYQVNNVAMEHNAKRLSTKTPPSPPIPPNRDDFTKTNVHMEDDYNGYLSFTSLEPPTPSRLNPTFTFPRRGLESLQSPRLSILPPMSRTKHPNIEFELRNNTRRSSSETPPRPTSVIDTKLLRHTVKAKMAQRRGSLETSLNCQSLKKGLELSLPKNIIEEEEDVFKPIEMFPWFRDVSRKRAERLLKEVGRDGTFLVRKSKNGGEESPYALTIYYSENMFHINIRAISGKQFALGKSKLHEMIFDSVEEIVKRHRYEPLTLIGHDGKSAGTTILSRFPLN